MARHLITLTATLLLMAHATQAGVIPQHGISYLSADPHEAVAHTQQNVLRNYDGTVSHYAKSVETPYSSVHKQDTRISNNVYQPAIAKAVAYAAPASYAQPESVHYAQPAPVHSISYSPQPALSSYAHSAPPAAHVAVHYSPAEAVSHMSFDGFGTHWGF